MTGSIEKRGKDSYRLVVFKGYDLDEKAIRRQKTIHCKNKSKARTELAKYLAEVENGFVVEGNVPTFKEFYEIWKRDYGLKELAPSTYNRYLGMLESRILIDNLEKLTGNDIKYKVAVLLKIFIGARLGELAGFEWSDIHFKNGFIRINKSSQ